MKNILKQFAPPIFLNFLRKLIAKNQSNQYSNANFLAWWKKFKSNSKLDSDVIEMVDAFTKSAAFDGMSRYWNYLNKKNLEQLSEVGFGNFKQTISANYYTWINGISGTLGANLIKDAHLYTRAVPISEITKIHDYFDI